MEWTQRLRAFWLAPLLRILVACRVTPDHLTLASLLCGLSFCGLWSWSKPAAFAGIVLHILLDGIDGPLARHLGVDSRRGSFTDTSADQLVVVGTTVTLMSEGIIDVVAGSLYVVLYTVVVIFAMVRNALHVPYSWLVRPRFFIYGWLLIETYLWSGSIEYVVWVFNSVLAAKLSTGFIRIRHQL